MSEQSLPTEALPVTLTVTITHQRSVLLLSSARSLEELALAHVGLLEALRQINQSQVQLMSSKLIELQGKISTAMAVQPPEDADA